jgi:hypothetical protein
VECAGDVEHEEDHEDRMIMNITVTTVWKTSMEI